MEFWIFMLIINLICPFVLIIFGRMFLKNIPEDINMTFGYRTKMSMKNKETWEFAHKYCGKIWYVCGIILLPLSIIPMFFIMGKNENTIGILGMVVCFIQVIIIVFSILPTEMALKKNFDEAGNKK